MATEHLITDVFDPETQQIVDRTEIEIYGQLGGLATDPAIVHEYLAGFRRPYVSALMHSVITDKRWGLGTTMTEIADNLGTDHSTISRALRWGILSLELETYILACPTKPDNWQKVIERVLSARHRTAFMSVAEYLWRKWPGTRWPMPYPLFEIHAEFLFTLWENRHLWDQIRATHSEEGVCQTVKSVVLDDAREVIPFWYDTTRRRWVMKLIDRMKADHHFALKWLSLLQIRWEAIFVTTQAATEERGWLRRSQKLRIDFQPRKT